MYMSNLQKDLLKIDGVSNVQIGEMALRKLNNQGDNPQPVIKVLNANIYTSDSSLNRLTLAKKAAEVIMDNRPSSDIKSINIKVTYSCSIGIANSFKVTEIRVDPNKWPVTDNIYAEGQGRGLGQ